MLTSLGYIAGRHTEALDYYRQSPTLLRTLGNACEEANTLTHIGEAHLALGDQRQTRDCWEQAADLYQAQHRDDDARYLRDMVIAIES
ncbi:hypothetical protein [Amycolatopsis alba]|uniref:Tetratricopeptide repeat protein n=1 Tax=Amycolatopsis alba DSM 44262 TaxID=1125972 RepID=A0A229RFE9_AMYAL|nr:hypothetical protein [Amycolatopsis alba]OXM45378.1 hypothetical protein CFP75_30975 [Amycolatopsis alba DSM 44262]